MRVHPVCSLEGEWEELFIAYRHFRIDSRKRLMHFQHFRSKRKVSDLFAWLSHWFLMRVNLRTIDIDTTFAPYSLLRCVFVSELKSRQIERVSSWSHLPPRDCLSDGLPAASSVSNLKWFRLDIAAEVRLSDPSASFSIFSRSQPW
jgi:hypothetical protein